MVFDNLFKQGYVLSPSRLLCRVNIIFYQVLTSENGYQNFLFSTKDENSELKAIDFGLSDFVKPGMFCVHFCTLHVMWYIGYRLSFDFIVLYR